MCYRLMPGRSIWRAAAPNGQSATGSTMSAWPSRAGATAIGDRVIVAGVLDPLMGLRLSDLTRTALDDALKIEAAARPTKARQTYSALGTFFNWCERRDEYKNLASGDVHMRHTARERLPKKKAKDDCLQREQLKSWFAAVAAIPNATIAAYLQVLLLTGARREEIAALKWSDVDFQWGHLGIDDKVEGERTIPLTPYVASLLHLLKALQSVAPNRRQQRRLDARGETWQPPEWVFASHPAEDGKQAEPRIGHNKALHAANLPHVSLHGLRRPRFSLSGDIARRLDALRIWGAHHASDDDSGGLCAALQCDARRREPVEAGRAHCDVWPAGRC